MAPNILNSLAKKILFEHQEAHVVAYWIATGGRTK